MATTTRRSRIVTRVYDAMRPPGSLVRKATPKAMVNALVHALPGIISGGLPFLALWMGLELVSVAVFMAVSLALAVGFWKYQQWEDRAIRDWSFIQWGEFVVGATLGAVVMVGLLISNRHTWDSP